MTMNVESSVRERYSEGARERQEALCCPVDYDSGLLAMLPDEIIEKDYGCGDPSRYVQTGDVVLDLGSGGGKICYMAAQLVGKGGQVIGVDMNDDMLALARRHQQEMAARLCDDRVRFIKGHIQDLALDIEALEKYLATNPVQSHKDFGALKHWEMRQRKENPLIADNSVDLVISNCVLNLVSDEEKQQLVSEIFRVLRPGGRVAISDIISDQTIPLSMKNNPELWSGCISGAFEESEFLQVFADCGFHAPCYDKWDARPWQVVEGIEFRSVTLTAVKPAQLSGRHNEASVIYRGPFAEVTDDAGNCYQRGKRVPVNGHTHDLLTGHAYKGYFISLSPGAETAACCEGEQQAAAAQQSRGNSCC
ncbi:MAG: methyltransferase domain-containing protein [Gammaproteobacteria bacterium]